MKIFSDEGGRKTEIRELSYLQKRQAAAVADCIGRLIPQEGVDFDYEIIFNRADKDSVSINIHALTDKGAFWKRYLSEMMRRYPPVATNPESSIKEENEGEQNAQDMS